MAAIGDAKTCPHGHPIVAGSRLAGVPLADVEVGATVRVMRFENEAEDLLHYLKASGLEPGLDGVLEERDEERVAVRSLRRAAAEHHAQRRRDGLGDRRPLTAAAHRPARAAGARAALRALSGYAAERHRLTASRWEGRRPKRHRPPEHWAPTAGLGTALMWLWRCM